MRLRRMESSKKPFILLPNRLRQLWEASLAFICPLSLWLCLTHTVSGQHVGWAITLVVLFCTCGIASMMRAVRNYPTILIDPDRRQIEWTPFIGNRISFPVAQISGFSSTTRSLSTNTHDAGIVLYVPMHGHFELKRSTHPQLKSLLGLLEQWQVPFFGQEYVLRFWGKPGYKFDT